MSQHRNRQLLTVVIPVRDAERTLPTQLEALANQELSLPWELVIADNGSRDRSIEVAASYADRLDLKITDASSLPGAAAARNAGARCARGDTLLFTDADDVVSPGWLAAFATSPHSFATGPLPRFIDGSSPEWTRDTLAPAPPTLLGFLPYAAGANFAIDRELFESFGGFDTAHPAGEDVELSWRLLLGGEELGFIPEAVVAVRDRSSVRATVRQYRMYGRHDAQLYREFRKHGVMPPGLWPIARAYGGLMVRTAAAWRPGSQVRWAQQLGRRWGRLEGSLRYGVWFP